MQDLVNYFEEIQNKYSKSQHSKFLKDSSQYFTPSNIAKKMLETIDLTSISEGSKVRILEPSAGCGILVLHTVLFLVENNTITDISIDAFETDENVYNLLSKNIDILKKYIKDNYNIKLKINLYNKNFILHNASNWSKKSSKMYDIIISNPPYNKINQSADEAIIMKDIVRGQPNLYHLFIAMSLKLLKENGTYVTLTPRNYLIGDYSKKLRSFIFENFSLTHIHSFNRRDLFKPTNQEVVISTYVNSKSINEVLVFHNGRFELKANTNSLIYDKEHMTILVPKSNVDLQILKYFSRFKCLLSNLNFKVAVGPVVQFRNKEFVLENVYEGDYAPLLISNDIQPINNINYFNRKNNVSRKTHKKSIHFRSKQIILNSNYLLLRKVTAKNDKDLLVPAVLHKSFFNHKYLGLDNNLLYFHKTNSLEMTLEECYGLYCIINSCYFKQLYSLINGTHTINTTDFLSIKFPDRQSIINMGKELLNLNIFDEKTCSKLLDKY